MGMKDEKIVIIGGVAGGASAAARLRRLNEKSEIIMLEKGEHISFANCGLPYYIGGVIESRDSLLVQTPEAMKARFNIDVRVLNEVMRIDREKKEIEIKKLETGELYLESYDKLILSPGSIPLRPPIPGIDSEKIFTLWNIRDVDAIYNYIDEKKPQNAIVIGGGFIGIETAENLRDRGLNVTLVEMANQIMAALDIEMAEIVQNNVRENGIRLILQNGVKTFHDLGKSIRVELQNGDEIEADMVMLSIGVRPQSKLAIDAGLEVNERKGIVVDDHMMTSDPYIYAIGDAIEVEDYISKDRTMIPLAGPANKQGRIAADNISGIESTYKGTQGTSIAKVFELDVATTGHNEKILNRRGLKYGEDYQIAIIHSKSHAGYYPGAIPMTIKVIYDNDGKVLGAQIVGYKGVDKRIDVIATAIRFGATIYDLKDLELAYAPPYSSAKDPVNMIGFVAENQLEKRVENILWRETELLEKSIIVDVRSEEERLIGYIPKSINIPLDELRERLDEIDRNKPIVVYCAIGLRGYIAARILEQNGFDNVKNYLGGYALYSCLNCKVDDLSDGCTLNSCTSHLDFSEDGKQVYNENNEEHDKNTLELNACGLACPGPIMKVSNELKKMSEGNVLKVRATDPGFKNDIKAWCNSTGNKLVSVEKSKDEIVAIIQKGIMKQENISNQNSGNKDKSMVVFSGDLDKAIAAFIIANGATSMGRKVTMFFTFWGINIIRKSEKIKVKKDVFGRAFGAMMPRGAKKLKLSRMNMGGAGPSIIKKMMNKNKIDQLEDLIQKAIDNGVELIACNMSMDLMGIAEAELIEGVKLGGVAAYLGAAEKSDVNLFI
jgi:NADPH-dependent 2,4-dienoyl-CoA reductase/sulfur reductase-like enzyme/peroxiredoxin family protein/TusA-related sulfurtransferase/rhodanese-related sulfurtransferase